MSLRQDDELPTLAPDQQAEAIRLALRLQEEHRAGSSQALIEAAEEAGIERRFLLEAVTRVAASRRAGIRPHNPSAGLALASMVAILSALWPFVPGLPGAVLLGFAVSLLPTLRGGSRNAVARTVVGAWLLLDLVLLAARIDVGGELAGAALVELAGTVLGISLAELVAATRVPQGRPRSIP